MEKDVTKNDGDLNSEHDDNVFDENDFDHDFVECCL